MKAATPGEQARAESPNESTSSLAQQPFSMLKTLLYSAANLGYGMFYALNNAVLTLYLKNRYPGIHESLLGLLGSSHSFEGVVLQPLVGAQSDRLHTRLGRRRPFMLIFAPLSALFLALTPAAGHLPLGVRLGALVACIFLFTVCFNVAVDPYQALMPDIFPIQQRGRVTGISMFVLVLGQVLVLLLPEKLLSIEMKFGLVAITMLITTLVTCVAIKEPEHPRATVMVHNHFRSMKTAIEGLSTLHQARKALIGVFFYGLGTGAVLPFLSLFVKNITHCSDEHATQMFLVLMVTTFFGVLPFGRLTDLYGPRNVLMLGLILIALASINGLWVTTLPQITVVMVLAGLGNAAQSAATYPLLTRLVPGEEIGFYTGLQTTALAIAEPLTSVVTGQLVHYGSYRWIFGVCSLSVGLAIPVLAAIKMSLAENEITARDREQGRGGSGSMVGC